MPWLIDFKTRWSTVKKKKKCRSGRGGVTCYLTGVDCTVPDKTCNNQNLK